MNKLILAAVASLFAANVALAQAPAAAEKKATTQQGKMKTCNAEAKGKKGDERKAFMKECLSAKKTGEAKAAPAAPAAASCEAKAAEKKLAGAAKASFIKKCETEGGK